MTTNESPSASGGFLLYLAAAVLCGVTWVTTFFAAVIIEFGDSSCGRIDPEMAHEGQVSLGAVALLAVLIWTGMFWLSKKRLGLAAVGAIAVLPAISFFVQGLDYQTWGNGWCF